MIFKPNFLIFLLLSILISKYSEAEEKYEGLIVSVDNEAITTYDLSERIKLVLKSLNLEDNIENRDSVRERVIELLIMEKLKKIEAEKAQISVNENDVIEFASVVYNFPIEDYEDFKSFIAGENIDFEVVFEQLTSELLWKKLSQRLFSTKITINSIDVDAIINNYKNKIGKTEYNFSEIFFINTKLNDWENSKKRMNTVLSLLENGTAFDKLVSKFSDYSQTNKSSAGWTLEDGIDKQTRDVLYQMKIGEIRENIKISNGYKIIKLNKKRKFGNKSAKYSFLKFSSFDKDLIKSLYELDIECEKKNKNQINNEIKFLELQNISAKDLSSEFLNQIESTSENNFSNIFELAGEYNLLLVCKKNKAEVETIPRDLVERRAFSKKFNQLSNTFIANIRKSANIKFFNK